LINGYNIAFGLVVSAR